MKGPQWSKLHQNGTDVLEGTSLAETASHLKIMYILLQIFEPLSAFSPRISEVPRLKMVFDGANGNRSATSWNSSRKSDTKPRRRRGFTFPN